MNKTLRAPRRHAPSVEQIKSGEVRKSYADCPFWLRNSVGRLAIGRECWALERLRSSKHAPRLVKRPDPFTVVTEFIEGQPLERLLPGEIDPDRLLNQAASLLHDLRAAGVVHADLGHDHWQSFGRECNLIWTRRETLVAIDFAGALPLQSGFPLLSRLTDLMQRHDQLLLSKIVFHFGAGVEGQNFPEVRWKQGTWELLRLLGKV